MGRKQSWSRKRRAQHRLLTAYIVLMLLVAVFVGGSRGVELWRQRQYARMGMQIAPVFQYDYPETVCCIAGQNKSVASSGCGAACMSMVIDYLTGDAAQSPQTLFEEAWLSGDYSGYGLSHEALSRLGTGHGVEGTWVAGDEEQLRAALAQGYPVIAHMGPGAFTKEGHYILLRGLTDDGRVLLNDPNSESRTRRAWNLSRILGEAKGNRPFMICRKKL